MKDQFDRLIKTQTYACSATVQQQVFAEPTVSTDTGDNSLILLAEESRSEEDRKTMNKLLETTDDAKDRNSLDERFSTGLDFRVQMMRMMNKPQRLPVNIINTNRVQFIKIYSQDPEERNANQVTNC